MESNIWYPYDGSPSSPVRRAKRGNAGASGASRNAAGELGKPPCGSRIPVPRCVETPRRCKGIACGLPPAELPGYAIVWVPYVGFHPLVASTAGDLPHDRPWAYEGKTRACRLLTRPVSVNGRDKRKGRELLERADDGNCAAADTGAHRTATAARPHRRATSSCPAIGLRNPISVGWVAIVASGHKCSAPIRTHGLGSQSLLHHRCLDLFRSIR